MKNITGRTVCLGLILAGFLVGTWAPLPNAREPPPRPVEGATGGGGKKEAAPATTGKVLLLDNESALTGDITRVGDEYRVRGRTGETAIPANRALLLCGSLEEAHRFLQGRANLNDPDERLRLADWCRQNGLKAQALVEAEEAARLDPKSERARGLVAYLRETAGKATPQAAPRKPDGPAVHVDLTEDALGQFAHKVQPILMNACASCHANGRGGSFKLARSYETALTGGGRTMHQNLAAVLAQVNAREPSYSPLLTKSVSVHSSAMLNAPIKDRSSAAYRALEDWLTRTLANNPQLKAQQGVPPPAVPPEQPAPRPAPGAFGEDRLPAPAPPAGAAAPGAGMPPLPPTPVPVPPGTALPAGSASPAPPASGDKPDAGKTGSPASASPNPVDPREFNRQFHPDRR